MTHLFGELVGYWIVECHGVYIKKTMASSNFRGHPHLHMGGRAVVVLRRPACLSAIRKVLCSTLAGLRFTTHALLSPHMVKILKCGFLGRADVLPYGACLCAQRVSESETGIIEGIICVFSTQMGSVPRARVDDAGRCF